MFLNGGDALSCTRGQELCALEFSDDANADACQP